MGNTEKDVTGKMEIKNDYVYRDIKFSPDPEWIQRKYGLGNII